MSPHQKPGTGKRISLKTLYAHFRNELDEGRASVGKEVANALYVSAVKNNNVAAQIWWSNARLRLSETVEVQMLDEHCKLTGAGH